jgi:hypothetical protein
MITLQHSSLPKLNVMKPDVDGHELDALQGRDQSLRAGMIQAVTLATLQSRGDACR